MVERSHVVVVGGGQAGLAVSHHLGRLSIDHVVLERSLVAESWRNRWHSFTLVIPNHLCGLPGFGYEGEEPEGFMHRDEVVDHFQRYAASFDAPIRAGVEATSIRRENDGAYRVETTAGELLSSNVVVATGAYPHPRIPRVAADLPDKLTQIHTHSYRDPLSLPPGGVLVCGAGQSGVQIAEDLLLAGRRVAIAAGACGWGPRRYRGRDTASWLWDMGAMHTTVDMLESPSDRLRSSLQVTGRDGGHDLNLRLLAERGVRLLGRLDTAAGETLSFGGDLAEALTRADDQAFEMVGAIDRHIEENGVDAPPPEDTPGMVAARGASPPEAITELDLRDEDLSTVIWATGYRLDFGWIDLTPLVDEQGFPIHRRGVSPHEGLYFVGLPWLHKATSSLIGGVGEDAGYIASHIAERVGRV